MFCVYLIQSRHKLIAIKELAGARNESPLHRAEGVEKEMSEMGTRLFAEMYEFVHFLLPRQALDFISKVGSNRDAVFRIVRTIGVAPIGGQAGAV